MYYSSRLPRIIKRFVAASQSVSQSVARAVSACIAAARALDEVAVDGDHQRSRGPALVRGRPVVVVAVVVIARHGTCRLARVPVHPVANLRRDGPAHFVPAQAQLFQHFQPSKIRRNGACQGVVREPELRELPHPCQFRWQRPRQRVTVELQHLHRQQGSKFGGDRPGQQVPVHPGLFQLCHPSELCGKSAGQAQVGNPKLPQPR